MAPEYTRHGKFSAKSDVFSFGVIVLEIVSGKKNSGFHDGENVEHLLSFVCLPSSFFMSLEVLQKENRK